MIVVLGIVLFGILMLMVKNSSDRLQTNFDAYNKLLKDHADGDHVTLLAAIRRVSWKQKHLATNVRDNLSVKEFNDAIIVEIYRVKHGIVIK
jgi:hypothetical protein